MPVEVRIYKSSTGLGQVANFLRASIHPAGTVAQVLPSQRRRGRRRPREDASIYLIYKGLIKIDHKALATRADNLKSGLNPVRNYFFH
jgi:hypothetical protein